MKRTDVVCCFHRMLAYIQSIQNIVEQIILKSIQPFGAFIQHHMFEWPQIDQKPSIDRMIICKLFEILKHR